jgi:hypothetical protein
VRIWDAESGKELRKYEGHTGAVLGVAFFPDGKCFASASEVTVTTAFAAQDLFEVRVYDENRFQRLVAAVEFVSPSNKDRPESRRAFAVKCASYLQQHVSVIVVDMVTEKHFNLHREIFDLMEQANASTWTDEVNLYAVAYRVMKEKKQWRVGVWSHPLTVGATLPTLPLWLAGDLAVPLLLEETYEETPSGLAYSVRPVPPLAA